MQGKAREDMTRKSKARQVKTSPLASPEENWTGLRAFFLTHSPVVGIGVERGGGGVEGLGGVWGGR